MELFIGNLPLNASVVDLRKLFGKIENGTRIRIYKSRLKDGTSKCYGHAVIGCAQTAENIISDHNGSMMQGLYIEVRLYEQRKLRNDRRAPLWAGPHWAGLNRRQLERRRKR